jgi:hypothetical protein
MAFDLLAELQFDHQWPSPPAHIGNAAAAAAMIAANFDAAQIRSIYIDILIVVEGRGFECHYYSQRTGRMTFLINFIYILLSRHKDSD